MSVGLIAKNELDLNISYASEDLDFGIDSTSFPNSVITLNLDQSEAMKNNSIMAIRDLRSKMWDEDVLYTLDNNNQANKTIRDTLEEVGITSKNEYLNLVKWSTDLEKIAIQRGFEVSANGFSHQRIDGSEYSDISLPNGIKSYSELLAYNSYGFTPQTAIDQLAFSKRANFNSKSEYESCLLYTSPSPRD